MNGYQLDLIEDPPPKNPYFTLPDPQFFLTLDEVERDEQIKPVHASVVDLFGFFNEMSDDQQTKFLLNLMKHSGFVPDYDAMAEALNLTSRNHVRRRFIGIAEKQGFQVEDDTIASGDGLDQSSQETPPANPPSKKAKTATKRAAPKRTSSRKSKANGKVADNQSTLGAEENSTRSQNFSDYTNTIDTNTGPSYLDDDIADVEDNIA